MSDQVRPVDNVLYLHGFNSHPTSVKAEMTRRVCAWAEPQVRFYAPWLSHRPQEAFDAALDALRSLRGRTLVIGSSMGGFLAACLARHEPVAAIAVINPAIHPSRIAMAYQGESFENTWTGETFLIDASHEQQARALETVFASPAPSLVLLGTADEVLDYREAMSAFEGSRFLLSEDDDHGLSRYPAFLPEVLAHGGLTLPASVRRGLQAEPPELPDDQPRG
ncbi:YqiA/YcfP family alpha/beta fold hydrolase [Kushneria phosphatilytica]|uniref:Esterase n=1 Tax=Kushneria phosphatilytica TaxID=657387 RepID=A0A1S1NUL9_9GAMM|nr:YqiA/YcfP family alpha/beta fold hydrolase [Kushneria phosphatilytica]OHV10051.1 hypothetical protein BH688_10245 [Kushneria phosphatilytica]QEL11667.1 esterase [Kushneria phosphatilytica]